MSRFLSLRMGAAPRPVRGRVTALAALAGAVVIGLAGTGTSALAADPTPTPPPLVGGIAVTEPATAIGATTATLPGTLTSGEADATYWFVYGPTFDYGQQTASKTQPAGDTATPVSIDVTGLSASTTYHYQLVAKTDAGMVRGVDRSFTTTAAPAPALRLPGVSTGAESDVTVTTATVSGKVDPHGQATSYYFEWGTGTSYGSRTAAAQAGSGDGPVVVTGAIGGLDTNTKYHYRLVATNGTGTALGSDRDLTTAREIKAVAIQAAAKTVAWNTTNQIIGQVAGDGAPGVRIVLWRLDWPYMGGPVVVAARNADAKGNYKFPVGPLFAAAKFFTIAQTTPTVRSPSLFVGSQLLIRPALARKRAGKVRLLGSIYPRVKNANVTLQRQTPGRRWVTVERNLKLKSNGKISRTRYAVTIARRGIPYPYRVVVIPNDGGAHVATTSKALTVPRR